MYSTPYSTWHGIGIVSEREITQRDVIDVIFALKGREGRGGGGGGGYVDRAMIHSVTNILTHM